MSIAERATYAVDEFLALPDSEQFELVDGYLVERNMGALSSWVGASLTALLFRYAAEHGGWVFGPDASYQCFPEAPRKVRRPDVSLIRAERMNVIPDGVITIAPDLAVEVISPNDTYYEVEAKVDEYLAAGVKLVWLISPQNRTVTIFGERRIVEHIGASDDLTAEELLPGFRCSVESLFPPQGDH
jgi:Uma2 family endonuclease